MNDSYVRKDQWESSDYPDLVPIPSDVEKSLQNNDKSVTQLESLLLSLINQLKDRYERVRVCHCDYDEE